MIDIGVISTSLNGEDVVIEWRIDSFSSLSEKDGAYYFSPDFSFSSKKWYLEIYPNSYSRRNSYGHVDLYLCKVSSCLTIRQEFSLSIKTLKGKKEHEKHCTEVFEYVNLSQNFNRFIPRSELLRRRPELVPHDVLTIVCTMKNMTSARSAINTVSSECCQCKEAFDAVRLSSHQKKCMHGPIICPDCLEVVVLQKWLDEHECQKKRIEAGKGHKETSENAGVDACIQTEEDAGKRHKETSEITGVDVSTQTRKEKGTAGSQLGNSDWQMKRSSADCNSKTEKGHKETSENACVDACIQTEEDASFINLPEDIGFVTDMNYLLKENKDVDVTFKLETSSGETKFFAHQLILSVMSSYFADEFYDQGRNKEHQVIPLKGINPKAFEQMIRYCYGEKPSLRTTEEAYVLFKIASKFKVISLQNLCCTFSRHTKISPGNVFSFLKISEEMEDENLKDMCYKILQDKTREVIATYELCDVTPFMVYTILDLPKLSLNSEYELIKWLFDWAKVKSEDSSSENVREYLQKLLQYMNFLALTFEEFAVLCKDNQDFFTSNEIGNVCMNIAFPRTTEMPDWYDKDLKCRVYTGSN